MKKLLATILGAGHGAGRHHDGVGGGRLGQAPVRRLTHVITTEAGLNKLATDVNSGTVYSGAYFKLGASITVTD